MHGNMNTKFNEISLYIFRLRLSLSSTQYIESLAMYKQQRINTSTNKAHNEVHFITIIKTPTCFGIRVPSSGNCRTQKPKSGYYTASIEMFKM
jgi:hypothetical protein